MPRVSYGSARAAKKRRLRKAAKGYFGARSKQYKTMISAVRKAGQNAYKDRRRKKREYRSLWITRITAACRARGMSYSRFANGLKCQSIFLNRKMLSELAIHDPVAFDKIVSMTQQS